MAISFQKFDDDIKMSYDDSSILREKRDLLLNDLRDGLKRQFSHNVPKFDPLNQGSYAMHTGVKPLEGEDYDIDIGILFHFSKDSYEPTEVKKWVFDALNTGNRTVEYKRPCIRVQYHKGGEIAYHVDLAIYSKADYNHGTTYLAKGYLKGKPEYQIWEQANPDKLKSAFLGKFTDRNDRQQFRRIIRYLKRWKDLNFSANGNNRPTGIALTACAMNWFQIGARYNNYDGKYYYDDLIALKNFVRTMINQFHYSNSINVQLPVQPFNNLFEKMSNNQMANFKQKLIILENNLIRADNETDTYPICQTLQSVFGNEFCLAHPKCNRMT